MIAGTAGVCDRHHMTVVRRDDAIWYHTEGAPTPCDSLTIVVGEPPVVATEGDVRALLRDLVNEINAANAGDMLEGYLDYLAADFNPGLQRAGLPTIAAYGERT